MIESFQIDRFRGLDNVQLDDLGQVNLLVGAGSSGKSNLLESLFLFCSNGDAMLIPRVLSLRQVDLSAIPPTEVIRRLDWLWSAGDPRQPFQMKGVWNGKPRHVQVSKIVQEAISIATVEGADQDPDLRSAIAAYELVTRTGKNSYYGTLGIHSGQIKARRKGRIIPPIQGRFITPLDQGRMGLAHAWTEVEDQGSDEAVLALLRALDPEVAHVRLRANEANLADVTVSHKRLGSLPIELHGAGLGKALAVACHLSALKDGILLIDEIDGSLHIGALAKVIGFLLQAAQSNTVQIFASTHSIETLDAFLDAWASPGTLFAKPSDMRILQLRREEDRTCVTSLNAEEAKELRENIGLDLRLSE